MSSYEKRTKRSITTTEKASSAGSKKVFDPELESFTKRTRFESSYNRESSKTQKLTIDKLIENILFALDNAYGDDDSGFYSNCKEFLTKGIESWKLSIVDRINTYEYFELALRHKPYADIEVEIIKEWKKNYLLFAIMTYWYDGIQKVKFQSLKHFHQKYDVYCEFVAQISSLIFRGWLTNWQKRLKSKDIDALNKIYAETSHFIITDSSGFKKVYEKIIMPLIEYETQTKQLQWKYDLEELNAKKCVFDLEKEENLVKTIEALRKFSREVRIHKKIELIREYRLTLQCELQQQSRALRNSRSKGHEIFQKDVYIDALIYCIVKGNLREIQSSMIYMQTLLGENLSILSKMQLNSYAIDLIAVVDFLCEKRRESLTSEEMEEKELRQIPMYNRFVSSPEIPADCEYFGGQMMMRKNMTEKQITEFVIKE